MPFIKGHTPWSKGKKLSQSHRDKLSKVKSGENNPAWKGGKLKFICKFCGKLFYAHRKTRKYCSNKCVSKCPKRLKKLSLNQIGKLEEKANHWTGDNVGYHGVHTWVIRHKGKARNHKCKFCKKQAHDWANINHKYLRKLKDYIPLCCSCHRKWDFKKYGRQKKA